MEHDPRRHHDGDSHGDDQVDDFEGHRRQNRNRDGGDGGNKYRFEVLVKSLSYKAGESDIEDFFSKCGKILQVNLQRNADRTSRGLCFIKFEEEEGMNAALALDQSEFMDRRIHVEKTRPRGERDAAGGSRGGREERGNSYSRRDDRNGGSSFGRRDRDGSRERGDRNRSRDEDRPRSNGAGYNKEGQSRSVFVGNLNFATHDGNLREFFEDCGSIKDIRVAKKPDGKVI